MYNEENTPCTCYDCGCVLDDDHYTGPDGEPYCDDCYHETFIPCDYCGDIIRSDETVYIQDSGEIVCEHCADNRGDYFRCDDCGHYFTTNRRYYSDDYRDICYNCSDDWRECSECGYIFPVDEGTYDEDEGEWFCQPCADERPSNTIHPYGYKPCPNFLYTATEDESARFYGLELEVDNGDNANDCAYDIETITNDVYMKHDGSLSQGFEIVTHPATLAYHMEEFKWAEIADTCREYDFLSHNTSTCGLHIHIGRAQLPTDTPEKLLIIFETHWQRLVSFSRRNYDRLQQWACKPEFGAHCTDTADTLKEKADKHKYRGRYQAVNLSNHSTIEIRIFRGTLRRDTIIASIQLLDALLDYCETHTAAEIMAATWEDLTHGTTFRELNEYLQGRGL